MMKILNRRINPLEIAGQAYLQYQRNLDNLLNDTNNLELNLQRKTPTDNPLLAPKSNLLKSNTLLEMRKAYNTLYSYGAIKQCHYAVFAKDIFGIQQRAGVVIPWFAQAFPMSWLATDVDYSIGSVDSESFYAGSHQCNYLTQQSSDTIDVTFIETNGGHIAKSAKLCKDIAMPNDGTVKEPYHYTFALFVMVFGGARDLRNPTLKASYLAAVKEGSINLSSGGLSEIAKTQVTFQKIRPYVFK